jgi:hypothetical protein
MSVFVIQNLLAAMALSKHYMHILYHLENTLSVTKHRLSMSFWFPFKMFPFRS